MAENYEKQSNQARERATEDLFSRDAVPDKQVKEEVEDLGVGPQGQSSEELFLQSILQGSQNKAVMHFSDEPNNNYLGAEQRVSASNESGLQPGLSGQLDEVVPSLIGTRGEAHSGQSSINDSDTWDESGIQSGSEARAYRNMRLFQEGDARQVVDFTGQGEVPAQVDFGNPQPNRAFLGSARSTWKSEPTSSENITDTSGNDAPTLEVVSSATLDEDGVKTLSFSAGDVDGTVSTTAEAGHGSISVNEETGEITYTPEKEFHGSDTITVTSRDDDGAQVVKTVSVTVNDINDAPTLEVVSSATLDEDGVKTLSFSAGDVDGTVSTTAEAGHGSISVNEESGEITYTPERDFHGTDTITVTSRDDDGAQVVKTVSVTVNEIIEPDENGIIGSEGDDNIKGTNGDDSLYGLGGDDFIKGKQGDDRIFGGDGDDKIHGDGGDDIIYGGAGNDDIKGGQGDDLMTGGKGDDVARGEGGNDTYIFNPFDGHDYFNGGEAGGWTDIIRLDATADPNADPDNPWAIEINGEQVQYDLADHALQLNPDTSGVITLADGSELTFDGIEKIEW